MSDNATSPPAAPPSAPARRRKFLVCVDETPECRVALRYACRRALATNGQVGLLRVIEPADYRGMRAIEERIREEAREEAELLLQRLAAEISEEVHIMPELLVREGKWYDEILKLIDEDPQVRILVLAADTGPNGPGPLVASLAGRMPGNMHIPVTVVPGNLTAREIDDLS